MTKQATFEDIVTAHEMGRHDGGSAADRQFWAKAGCACCAHPGLKITRRPDGGFMDSVVFEPADGGTTAWLDLFPVQSNGARHGSVTAMLSRKDASAVHGPIGSVSYRPDCQWFASRGGITEHGERGVLKGPDGKPRYFGSAEAATVALIEAARKEVGR